MEEATPRISEAEWDVMEVLWAEGPATAGEVIDRLAETRDWGHRTIRTMLARLVQKGALRREDQRARSLYRAVVDRNACVREEGASFLRKVFGGNAASLLAHFAEDARLSDVEVERLRKLLDQNREDRSQ